MSLPFILDIAIGLIVIYVILSLLASEIQQQISTLLQWPAKHLKESIEVLLSGNEENTNASDTRAIADTLYSHPLIKNLNQEAQGAFAKSFRQVSHSLFSQSKKDNVFGKDVVTQEERKSAPSHIPPNIFARAMMDILKISDLNRLSTLKKLEDFKENVLQDKLINFLLKDSQLSDSNQDILKDELEILSTEWEKIIDNFKAEKLTLKMCIDSFANKLGNFVESCKERLSIEEPGVQDLMNKIAKIKRNYFHNDVRQQLMNELNPKMMDLVAEVREAGELYETIKESIDDKDTSTYKTIHAVYSHLPKSMKQSLAALAKKIDERSSETEDKLAEFEKEIELWFDRSMQRASGVYNRNAKGVAILIGLVVAVGANADTLYMVNSLSSNSVLRSTISVSAERLVDTTTMPASTEANAPADSTNLNQVKNQVRDALEDVSLPIGWNPSNLEGQAKQEIQIGSVKIPFLHRFVGWFISGIAISMGSSFWFQLLGKLINIKNMGKESDQK